MNQMGEGSNFLLGQENWDSKVSPQGKLQKSFSPSLKYYNIFLVHIQQSQQLQVWFQIPLRLELAANEVTTVDKPPPLYVSVPCHILPNFLGRGVYQPMGLASPGEQFLAFAKEA